MIFALWMIGFPIATFITEIIALIFRKINDPTIISSAEHDWSGIIYLVVYIIVGIILY